MQPIWKDYFVDFTPYLDVFPFVDYRIIITQGSYETVYVGRAYKNPDGSCKVRINDICADYLGHLDFRALPETGNIMNDTAASLDFQVRAMPSDALIASGSFYNDWSYEDNELTVMPHAFGGVQYPGIPYIITLYGFEGYSYVSHYAVTLHVGTDFCNEAALYFWSSDCGWDWLICKGGAKRVDTFERNTMKREYDNTQNERGTFNYQNIDNVAWDVYTGRMRDEYAKNMHKLVGSTDVWLWTSESGFVPVVITTNEAQELTYKKNGRRPVEYTLRVELAQDRQRR
ncbi:MAG: hypothetical protein KBS70_08735 [Bacteroidales bacterium]|nr:hypothetical protein [Candidatus Colicola equi]